MSSHICFNCDNEFSLPKGQIKRDELYFKKNPVSDKKLYICLECYDNRMNSEYRIIDGDIMCANRSCVRNSMAFSIYCEVCENEYL